MTMQASDTPSTPATPPEAVTLYGADARASIAKLIAGVPYKAVGVGNTIPLTIEQQKSWFADMVEHGTDGPVNMVMVPNPDDAKDYVFLAVTGVGSRAAYLANFFASAPGAIHCLEDQLAEAVAILRDVMIMDQDGCVDGRGMLPNDLHQRIEELLGSDKPRRPYRQTADVV